MHLGIRYVEKQLPKHWPMLLIIYWILKILVKNNCSKWKMWA